MMDFDFTDRTLLITGAAGAIGGATVRFFRARGAHVVLADRDDAALRRYASEIGPGRGALATIAMDASQAADAQRAVELCGNRFGGIDFVVTAAGIYFDEPAVSMTDEQWHRTLAANLDGVFHICKAAFPLMRERSSIVNVASMAAHCGGSIGHSHYGAAKGGVLAYTRGLARELAPKTRVNAVSPGVIDTPMTLDMLRTRGASVIEQTPLRRYGRAEEVASVIAFLCSDAASFVTGEAIHVNGGLYMGG
jgi:3-oxoacyl-[acyl-carrier protein] reductase